MNAIIFLVINKTKEKKTERNHLFLSDADKIYPPVILLKLLSVKNTFKTQKFIKMFQKYQLTLYHFSGDNKIRIFNIIW